VVVEGGLAIALPEAGTEPPPGTMVIDVAPETLQLTLEFPPTLMLAGSAVRERIRGKEGGVSEGGVSEGGAGENGVGEGVGVGGAAAVATATVTDLVTLPAELVAVMV